MNTIENVFRDIPIFWINLSDSNNRHNSVMEQLKDYKNNFRIDAVDGRNELEFKEKYNVKFTSNNNFTTALIAVVCSHGKAIKKGYDDGWEMICVFEDDFNLELLPNYPHTLNDIIKITPDDWEIIQLYHTNKLDEHLNDYAINGLKTFRRYDWHSGTCYLINKKGMENILNNVIRTDGNKNYEIMTSIIDPEEVIYSKVISYVLNIPFLYYYNEKMTFDRYTNDAVDIKGNCQIIQFKAKNILINFIQNLPKNNIKNIIT